jgi:cyclopropane-fatty-acyl-phospholipid synthase
MATRAEIQRSYDVGNDFFRLWLDTRMNYSCALWNDATTLEQAQANKLVFLSRLAHVGSDTSVLDIGCGWGANLQHLSESGAAAAHGITLSPAQFDWIVKRDLPRVTAEVVDYRDFAPPHPFGAAISICMFEHIATPDQARRGEHMAIFRDFFARVHRWTSPGAWFALQTIVFDRTPRGEDLLDVARATRDVLPGSRCARFEEVVMASSRHWELVDAVTRRTDYVRTCEEWLSRLRAHRAEITGRWGEDVYATYDHYLRTCRTSFLERYLSLVQISFRRID